jgi:AcrR family transcriptional regulator
MAVAPPRSRLAAPARRELIMRTAGPVFARDGYAATRLDDVAAAAGVTKPIIYRHFDSKKGLYMALLAKHSDDLPGFFEEVEVPSPAPVEETVRAVIDVWLDYVRENRHSWVMLFRDLSGDDEIRALRTDVSRRAREVMAGFIALVAGDRIPAEQIEPTAEVLTSGLAGMVLWWIDHPEVGKPVLAEVATRICLAALPEG